MHELNARLWGLAVHFSGEAFVDALQGVETHLGVSENTGTRFEGGGGGSL